ncbi:MAG: hypothetical protein IJM83_07240 [Firmicutes bacterium]|nr:hypothetical protein [Bacillota bacterium]
MNKTYVAMTMNNENLNIGTIYFTDAFISADVVNPATQKKYTEEEKAALQAADLAAPENAVIAISSVSPEEVLWFDLENAKAIVSHTDPLIIKGSEMITTDGTVVAKAL